MPRLGITRSAATVLAGLVLLPAAPSHAAEQRCGWVLNPTPGNWWLRDRDGEWTLGVQGGYQAPGADLPDLSEREWVATNGNHGYGCACLTVEVDRAQMRVERLVSARQLPLARCRADRALPRPG